MRHDRWFWFVILMLLLTACAADAQSVEPLSIPPNKDLGCARHSNPDSVRAQLGSVVYRFTAGTRWFYASYDSTGGLKTLTEGLIMKDSAGDTVTDVRSLFVMPPEDMGTRRIVKHGGPSDPATGLEPLTSTEKRKARVLAAWLWAHRCR